MDGYACDDGVVPAGMNADPRKASARFAHLLTLPDEEVPLDEAMLLIAAHAHPALDVSEEQARLDELAAGCEPTFDALWRRLFVEVGLTGDPGAFNDPTGSFLDSTLARRSGLPITLTVVAMEVGRRLGLVIEGVGMPFHFLARYPGPEPVLFDPFHGGARLDEAEAEALYQSAAGPDTTLHPSHLAAVGNGQILGRVLANLKASYSAADDRAALAWVLELKIHIPGSPLADHAQLAGVWAGLGRAREAAELLEDLAHRLPEGASQRAQRKADLLRSTLN